MCAAILFDRRNLPLLHLIWLFILLDPFTHASANPPSVESSNLANATDGEPLTVLGKKNLKQSTPQLSTKQILTGAINNYRDCSSYMDVGFSQIEFKSPAGWEKASRIEFRTAYQRKGPILNYRFSYRANYYGAGFGAQTILWHDERDTLLSNTVPIKFEHEESLEMATAKITGTSLSTAYHIPALLMPKFSSSQNRQFV